MAKGCEHNADYECAACTDALHSLIHPERVDGCLACKLDSVQVGERVLSRTLGGAPAGNRNSWEAGIAVDHRGVPLLAPSGELIGVKEYAQKRSVYEADRRRLASDPNPFPTETRRH